MLISQQLLCSVSCTLYNENSLERMMQLTVLTPSPKQWFIRETVCVCGSTIASHLLHHSFERSERFCISLQRGLAISGS